MKIKKINKRIEKMSANGIFHDSRSDIRELSKAVNMLIDKVNELVEEHNKTDQKE